jgi:hypothetical protein
MGLVDRGEGSGLGWIARLLLIASLCIVDGLKHVSVSLLA